MSYSDRIHQRATFRKFIEKLVDSKLFGGTILFIILLNTVILIVQTNEEISVKGGMKFISLCCYFLFIYFFFFCTTACERVDVCLKDGVIQYLENKTRPIVFKNE